MGNLECRTATAGVDEACGPGSSGGAATRNNETFGVDEAFGPGSSGGVPVLTRPLALGPLGHRCSKCERPLPQIRLLEFMCKLDDREDSATRPLDYRL